MRMRAKVFIATIATMAAACAVAYAARTQADRQALLLADPESLRTDPRFSLIVMDRGPAVYARACASCHGDDGKGSSSRSVPDLTDRKRLYGDGHVAEIERIVLHGIRAGDSRGWKLSSMPAFARQPSQVEAGIGALSPSDIQDVTAYLLSIRRHAGATVGAAMEPTMNRASVERGRSIFAKRGACYDCHGDDARGDSAIGAPDLTDGVWLYGDGSADAIARSIEVGRAGVCPAFSIRMDAADARAVAAFVAGMPARSNQEVRK